MLTSYGAQAALGLRVHSLLIITLCRVLRQDKKVDPQDVTLCPSSSIKRPKRTPWNLSVFNQEKLQISKGGLPTLITRSNSDSKKEKPKNRD